MSSSIFGRLVSLISLLLLASLLISCSSNSVTSTGNTPVPTLGTPAQAATMTPTSAPDSDASFQQFTGTNFTIKYPTSWKASQSKTSQAKTVYSFLYSDQVTGFHVEVHAPQYLDASTLVSDLTGSNMVCDPGDTSLPTTKTVNGISWYQNDLVCLLASTNYEIRVISYTNPQTKDATVIVYGAYQQATASPVFAQAETEYFEPMWTSFQFTS